MPKGRNAVTSVDLNQRIKNHALNQANMPDKTPPMRMTDQSRRQLGMLVHELGYLQQSGGGDDGRGQQEGEARGGCVIQPAHQPRHQRHAGTGDARDQCQRLGAADAGRPAPTHRFQVLRCSSLFEPVTDDQHHAVHHQEYCRHRESAEQLSDLMFQQQAQEAAGTVPQTSSQKRRAWGSLDAAARRPGATQETTASRARNT